MTTTDIMMFQHEIQDFKSKFIYSKIHEDEVNESMYVLKEQIIWQIIDV